MLRLLLDQDFNQDLSRGLLQRIPDLDLVTALDVGLSDAPDREVIAWASIENRLILTHDRRTMPNHAADEMATGKDVAGIIVVPRRLPIRQVLDDLEIVVRCSDAIEWINVIRHLPL
jgi:hypothetical protein